MGNVFVPSPICFSTRKLITGNPSIICDVKAVWNLEPSLSTSLSDVEFTKYVHEIVSRITFYPYVVLQGYLSDFWSTYATMYYKDQGTKDCESTRGSGVGKLLEF